MVPMFPMVPMFLQITILEIKDWDENKCQYSKENLSLEQNLKVHNQLHDFNQNTSIRKDELF